MSINRINHSQGAIPAIYVNGVGSSKSSDLDNIKKKLKTVTNSTVYMHENFTTPFPIIYGIAALILIGSYFIPKTKHPAMPLAGLFSATLGAWEYRDIQVEKNKLASTLKNKIISYLKDDKKPYVNLILHSQGADVGQRALKMQALNPYRKRIRVVTLGRMVNIDNKHASMVINFEFKKDPISKLATVSTLIQKKYDICFLNSSGLDVHSALSYLEHKTVSTFLKKLS